MPSTSQPRETSGATTTLLLRYVLDRGGEQAVADVLELAGVTTPLAVLEDASHWISYDARVRLFEAATTVLDDPRTAFNVGATSLMHGMHHAMVPLLRAFGSPREVFRQLPRAVPKFTTTSTMDTVKVSAHEATLSYRLHDGYVHSRRDCEYAQGLFAAVPTFFGMPAAEVRHDECESDGYPICLYQVRWAPRRRWWSRESRRRSDSIQLASQRLQLQEFQLAAADLVSSDDIEEVLERIVERAASAILAPSYLLAVRAHEGADPLIRYRGVDPARAPGLAARLLDGSGLGDSAVVVDVVSQRHLHGRLAAIYSAGHEPLTGDRELLSAYAQHAAATLDLLTALEGSRLDQRRTETLLELAHDLATSCGPVEVATAVAAAVPRIVGSHTSAVLLWDADRGELEPVASWGHTQSEQDLLHASRIDPIRTPELIALLTNRGPVVLNGHTASADLSALVLGVGTGDLVVVPLLAGEALLGVVVAGWRDGTAAQSVQVVLTRIAGVADQAGAALQNARLLDTVRRQASHDSLTGLANRVLFAQQLGTALEAARPELSTAVLFCDLDNFKHVNDYLGHGAGDELIRQVAQRLRSVVGAECTVGRLGGDEFAVVLPHVSDDSSSLEVARSIVQGFDAPFRIEGRELRVTTSVGVALHAGRDGNGDRLLAAADRAMYEAKRRGRNQVALAGDTTQGSPGPSLHAELRSCLADGQLRLHVQPIVQITDADRPVVVGAEALVRWQHPRLGLLSPASFLPLAEESGMATEIDLWVIDAACRALAGWPEGDGPRPLHIAVNLASTTLIDDRLLPTVRAALSRHGISPARLVLEIVESRSLADLPGVVEHLVDLRRLGVRIALDDFGTGYSTLAWLEALPVDQIKIDQSFTAGLPGTTATALVRGVLALARELEIDVVAEGVETVAQLTTLREVGCYRVQGYLLARPTPQLMLEMAAPQELRMDGCPVS